MEHIIGFAFRPQRLRGFFDGQHSLVQVLPTDSKVQANRMKAAIVEMMLEQIQLAERRHVNDERSAPIDKQILWADWISGVKKAQKNGEELPWGEYRRSSLREPSHYHLPAWW
jgi:hypothetical protein